MDLDHLLTQGTTTELEPTAATSTPADVLEQLTEALERSRRLLARLSGARRAELVEGLQALTDAVATAVRTLSDESNPPPTAEPE